MSGTTFTLISCSQCADGTYRVAPNGQGYDCDRCDHDVDGSDFDLDAGESLVVHNVILRGMDVRRLHVLAVDKCEFCGTESTVHGSIVVGSNPTVFDDCPNDLDAASRRDVADASNVLPHGYTLDSTTTHHDGTVVEFWKA